MLQIFRIHKDFILQPARRSEKSIFSRCFLTKTLFTLSTPPCVLRDPPVSFSLLWTLDTCRNTQIMKFLAVIFSTFLLLSYVQPNTLLKILFSMAQHSYCYHRSQHDNFENKLQYINQQTTVPDESDSCCLFTHTTLKRSGAMERADLFAQMYPTLFTQETSLQPLW